MLAAPGHALAVSEGEQQLELLVEQLVVVAEVVAEQWERLDERAPPRHDLRAAARDQVDVGELLEDPDGVFRREDRHRAREPDLLRLRRDRGERRRRGRDEVVGAVMLADGEDLQPQVVGETGLLEEVAHPLLGADAGVEVGESDESEIHTE